MQDVNAPESLREFQISYGRHIRNPNKVDLPSEIPARRSEIYENLLFNNICGFINSCFPVAHSMFELSEWGDLQRAFFDEWRCTTPIFSQIPYEFVRFISERPIGENLPLWLPELLHYEWVELEVDLDESEFDHRAVQIKLNPTARLLAYQWPVHTISKNAQPKKTQQSFLVVYRDVDLKVRFTEINATTFMLLQSIQDYQQPINTLSDLDGLVTKFAEQIGHPDPKALLDFGLKLLGDLKVKQVLTGSII